RPRTGPRGPRPSGTWCTAPARPPPPNDTLHLPGHLQGRSVSENRNAGPVKCKGWFAGDSQSTSLHTILQRTAHLLESATLEGAPRTEGRLDNVRQDAQRTSACRNRLLRKALCRPTNTNRKRRLLAQCACR